MLFLVGFFGAIVVGILLVWLGAFGADPLETLATYLREFEARNKAWREDRERQEAKRRQELIDNPGRNTWDWDLHHHRLGMHGQSVYRG